MVPGYCCGHTGAGNQLSPEREKEQHNVCQRVNNEPWLHVVTWWLAGGWLVTNIILLLKITTQSWQSNRFPLLSVLIKRQILINRSEPPVIALRI